MLPWHRCLRHTRLLRSSHRVLPATPTGEMPSDRAPAPLPDAAERSAMRKRTAGQDMLPIAPHKDLTPESRLEHACRHRGSPAQGILRGRRRSSRSIPSHAAENCRPEPCGGATHGRLPCRCPTRDPAQDRSAPEIAKGGRKDLLQHVWTCLRRSIAAPSGQSKVDLLPIIAYGQAEPPDRGRKL